MEGCGPVATAERRLSRFFKELPHFVWVMSPGRSPPSGWWCAYINRLLFNIHSSMIICKDWLQTRILPYIRTCNNVFCFCFNFILLRNFLSDIAAATAVTDIDKYTYGVWFSYSLETFIWRVWSLISNYVLLVAFTHACIFSKYMSGGAVVAAALSDT